MILRFQVAGIQRQLELEFPGSVRKFSCFQMNQTGVEVSEPHFLIQRERRSQLLERLGNITAFVMSLAKQDMQLRAVCADRNHLLDHAVCCIELSIFE